MDAVLQRFAVAVNCQRSVTRLRCAACERSTEWHSPLGGVQLTLIIEAAEDHAARCTALGGREQAEWK